MLTEMYSFRAYFRVPESSKVSDYIKPGKYCVNRLDTAVAMSDESKAESGDFCRGGEANSLKNPNPSFPLPKS